jgi:hypothetical protein
MTSFPNESPRFLGLFRIIIHRYILAELLLPNNDTVSWGLGGPYYDERVFFIWIIRTKKMVRARSQIYIF